MKTEKSITLVLLILLIVVNILLSLESSKKVRIDKIEPYIDTLCISVYRLGWYSGASTVIKITETPLAPNLLKQYYITDSIEFNKSNAKTH